MSMTSAAQISMNAVSAPLKVDAGGAGAAGGVATAGTTVAAGSAEGAVAAGAVAPDSWAVAATGRASDVHSAALHKTRARTFIVMVVFLGEGQTGNWFRSR